MEKTKNKRPLMWPLERELKAMVEQAVDRAKFPHSYLLPGPKGGCAMTSIHRHFRDVVEAAGLTYGRDAEDGVTFHTLRHTMASLALNPGIPASTVQRMGNWKSPTMVSRYAHLQDEVLRAAARELDQIVEGAPEADGGDGLTDAPSLSSSTRLRPRAGLKPARLGAGVLITRPTRTI